MFMIHDNWNIKNYWLHIHHVYKVISERLNGLVFYKDHDKLGLKSFRELND